MKYFSGKYILSPNEKGGGLGRLCLKSTQVQFQAFRSEHARREELGFGLEWTWEKTVRGALVPISLKPSLRGEENLVLVLQGQFCLRVRQGVLPSQ